MSIFREATYLHARPHVLAAATSFLLSASPVLAQGDAPVLLDEIVVEQEVKTESDLPQGFGVDGQTLRRTPGSAGDPLRSLQAFPGFVFTDDEAAEPAVRGSRPEDNIVEVDFVPGGYLFHAGGIVSVFNAELVESFDIYPSAYGPEFVGVTGGVFDVRLRDPKTDRLHGTLDVNFLQAGALVEGPVSDTQSFYLAGRISYLDLLIEGQLEDEEGIVFTQFPKYTDYQGKYVWTPRDGTTLRAQVAGATDDVDVLIDEDFEEIAGDPLIAGRNLQSERYDRQSLVWLHEGEDGLRVTSALSHSVSETKGVFGGAGNIDVSFDSLLLKSRASLPLADAHELSFGATVRQVITDYRLSLSDPACTEFESECRLTGSRRLDTDKSLSVVATEAFIKDSWFVTDALTLYPGLAFQAENYLDMAFVEPRFSLEYEMPRGTILNAAAGLYHQFPGVAETDDVFGNPQLDYIRSLQALAGLQHDFGGRWNLKADIWYKTLDRLITGNETLRFDNDGEGHAFGLDLLLRAELSDRLSGWLSLGLSEARRRNGGTGETFAFDYDQPVNASVVARYALNSKWSLGGKWWVHSGAPYTEVTGATPNAEIPGLFDPEFGPINGARLPSYSRLDLRLDRTFKRASGNSLDVYLEVLNALDSKNLSYSDYNADYSEEREVTQLPRIASIGLTARF